MAWRLTSLIYFLHHPIKRATAHFYNISILFSLILCGISYFHLFSASSWKYYAWCETADSQVNTWYCKLYSFNNMHNVSRKTVSYQATRMQMYSTIFKTVNDQYNAPTIIFDGHKTLQSSNLVFMEKWSTHVIDLDLQGKREQPHLVNSSSSASHFFGIPFLLSSEICMISVDLNALILLTETLALSPFSIYIGSCPINYSTS